MEFYHGGNNAWQTLLSGAEATQDDDGDTKISFETGTSDNDEIDFFTAGTQRMQITSNGNFAFGQGLNKFTIDFTTGATQIDGDNVHKGNSGVVAGAYGAGTLIPQIIVDAEGHITGISTVTPVFTPTANSINDTHIDFGTGTNQVSTDDIPEGSTNKYFSAGLADVLLDTTPQLGGDLDVNGNSIVSSSSGNIVIQPNGPGIIVLSGMNFPTSDGSANQFLKTDGNGQLGFSSSYTYSPAQTSDWNGTAPSTIEEAVDRLATLVKALNGGTGA